MKKVAIGITTYNDVTYTREALRSLFQHTSNTDKFEYTFILLDDASPSLDTSILVDEFKEHKIVYFRNEKNLGLTSLWNKGYQLSKENSCSYYIICNNDILFSPNWASNLLEALHENTAFLAAGPLTNAPGHVKMQHIHNVYKHAKLTNTPTELNDISEKISTFKPIRWFRLNGFCMAFNISQLQRHEIAPGHPFNPDQNYRIYGAESELFKRAKSEVLVVLSSYVFHYKQVTLEKHLSMTTNFMHQRVRV